MKFSEKMWFIIIVKATEKSGLHPLSQGFLSGHPLSGLHPLSWKHNFKKNHMVDQIDPSSLFRVYDKLMTSKKNCLQNKGQYKDNSTSHRFIYFPVREWLWNSLHWYLCWFAVGNFHLCVCVVLHFWSWNIMH